LRRGRRRRSRQQPQCRRCRQSIDVADEDSQRLALARLEEPDLDPGQAAVSEQCVRQDPRDAQAESEISERESFVFFRFRRTVFRHRRRPHRSLSTPPQKKKKTSRAQATATTARPTAQPTSSPASPTASSPRGTSRERKLEKGRSTPAVSAPSPRSRPLITRSRPRTRRPGRGRRTTGRSPAPRRRWGECCSPRGTAPGSTTATERARRETRAARVRPWPLLPPRSSRRGGAGPGSRSR